MARDLPSLNALKAFEVAARLESVSQAADELHVTHGAVSRQIRQLEDELGVALFDKVGRGIQATVAGRQLRDACRDAFSGLREVCADIRQAEQQAPFLLACPGSLLARWFIPRLDRLNAELPELNLHLSASEGELDPRRAGPPRLGRLICRFTRSGRNASVRCSARAMPAQQGYRSSRRKPC